MPISPLISAPAFPSEQLNYKEYNIDNYNNILLEFDKKINDSTNISLKQKIEFNNEIIGLINEIKNLHDSHFESSEKNNENFIAELQILKIKFGMVAIKYADTDWESFGLSEEIFKNNHQFLNSHLCRLSLDEQQRQNITDNDINQVWYCCLYNFAYELAHNKVAPPADKNHTKYHTEYYSIVDKLKAENLPEDKIFAIANARSALILCRDSFVTESPKDNALFIALKEVNKFYDNYFNINENTNIEQLELECEVLMKEKSLYIAESIKQELQEFRNN